MEAEPKDIKLRQRIAAENPGIWAYQRTMLEAEMAETLAGFVAERLGVASTSDPRPQVWAALVMVTFRIGFHVWLDGGQAGGLRSAVESSLAAAAEATSVLTGPLPGV
jgi:hypothetical protein